MFREKLGRFLEHSKTSQQLWSQLCHLIDSPFFVHHGWPPHGPMLCSGHRLPWLPLPLPLPQKLVSKVTSLIHPAPRQAKSIPVVSAALTCALTRRRRKGTWTCASAEGVELPSKYTAKGVAEAGYGRVTKKERVCFTLCQLGRIYSGAETLSSSLQARFIWYHLNNFVHNLLMTFLFHISCKACGGDVWSVAQRLWQILCRLWGWLCLEPFSDTKPSADAAAELRRALVDLGPSFVKLGKTGLKPSLRWTRYGKAGGCFWHP